jgi:hypothetical protein
MLADKAGNRDRQCINEAKHRQDRDDESHQIPDGIRRDDVSEVHVSQRLRD